MDTNFSPLSTQKATPRAACSHKVLESVFATSLTLSFTPMRTGGCQQYNNSPYSPESSSYKNESDACQ